MLFNIYYFSGVNSNIFLSPLFRTNYFIALLFLLSTCNPSFAQVTVLSNWKYHMKEKEAWSQALVPGAVHTDLLRNKVIADPFLNANEKQLQWVGDANWNYVSEFTCSDTLLSKPFVELLFEGLDTYAMVYLNDSLILQADNMFRSWRVDVKNLLKRKNILSIQFSAPETFAKKEASKLPYALPEGLRSFTRKAQYHYGWDWGPKLLSCGIWKPVKLIARESCSLLSMRIVQDHRQSGTVRAVAIVKIKSSLRKKATLVLRAAQFPVHVLHEVTIEPGEQMVKIPFLFPDAKPWQPNGKGDQPLYAFSCCLENDTGNAVHCKTGFREVELILQKDSAGISFGFSVNGAAVFAKGANIVPPDVFLARVADAEYEDLVLKARNAGMNMLRVWGGGIYLPDVFYDYCDKYGIMVWQDFMFACSMVPGDDHFVENVKQEAIEQVERLSSHPCLVLWCGNNESDEGWHNWGWQKQFNYSPTDSARIWKDYLHLFHSVLPGVIDSLDSSRAYWPSSPSLGWGRKESRLEGDSHYWGVWWGMEPFQVYKQKTGRFMSEYGFQSLPDLSIWRNVVDTLSLQSQGFKNHQKHPRGFETIDTYLKMYFGTPSGLADYTYLSQLQQAYGMKIAMGSHRSHYPYCRGTLFWQLNDCWPVISWSALDSREHEKLFYYEAKRSFDSLFVSTAISNKGVSSAVHFDGVEEKSLTLRLYTIKSDVPSEPVILAEKSIRLKPDTLIEEALFFPKIGMRNIDTASTIFVTEVMNNFTFAIEKRDYFHACLPKNLHLSPAAITLHVLDESSLLITTDVFAYGVYLYDDKGNCSFSDNGFHLMPGERKLVTIKGDVTTVMWKCFNNVVK